MEKKLFPRMAQGVEGGIASSCRFFIGFRSMSETNSAPSVLSKEMLLEIGGWRAMQEGRSLWEAGNVMSVD